MITDYANPKIEDFLPIGRVRTENGWYRYLAHPQRPNPAVLADSKKQAKKNIKAKNFSAGCPCCIRNTAVPSDVTAIVETGVCGWCNSYLEGKVDYVEVYQPPLLSDVLARAEKGYSLQPIEAEILLKNYKAGAYAKENQRTCSR